ncbi:MAG: RNA-binding transcriptional accessory protein [Kiritimatiellae bacterium]|nr:RNA-binding transcriptional accessory protein [Kiritimatiellia bacterium]
MEKHIVHIAKDLNIDPKKIAATILLLNDGSTVPFIARYRKEATGQLDEVIITAIRDQLARLIDLDQRRDTILSSLKERDLLTDKLKESVEAAETMSALEDIYLPFRPKRRTRAMIAREKGLEPLAQMIFDASIDSAPDVAAEKFVSEEQDVADVTVALAGARDIIAEWINEDAEVRKDMRNLFAAKSTIQSSVATGAKETGIKFKDYYEWSEPILKSPGHRVLAMFRGEKESFLNLRIRPAEETAISIMEQHVTTSGNAAASELETAVKDCYKRLLSTSMEVETRAAIRKEAGEEAIKVFAENLRELLMSSPLGGKPVLAIDPAFRTGCKIVCLDAQGKLLYNAVLYLSHSDRQLQEAVAIVKKLCDHFKIEAIAIGNGTASRETETFIRGIDLPANIQIVVVNESGASIYSASEIARKEFPDHDLTVRGAVSIGRRLMDPLSELVKLDPKSIGVGQYQHDVDQTSLKHSLDDVVVACVNSVGVEVNSASQQLLAYVSGLSNVLAANIIDYRNENGPFTKRSELKKVPRLGAKAFEQAAGFLRIRESNNPLDASAVHPESYHIVKQMATDAGCTVKELMTDKTLQEKISLADYVTDTVGMPTLRDIMTELSKPGRDPRKQFESFSFADGITSMAHLTPGMKLPGIVTNVTKFGAFIDIGVHQDGLAHISELADRYVSDPSDVVKVQQKVEATILEIDIPRKRISLSLKSKPQNPTAKKEKRTQPKARPANNNSRRGSSQGFGSLGNAFEGLSL